MLKEVIIELSHNCNLSCIMCGYGRKTNKYSLDKFMPFEKYKIILSEIGEETKTIRLNGRGESTIHPDFFDIMEYTKFLLPYIGINLFTNLSFNNHKITDSFLKYEVQLFISIDSPVDKELSRIRRGVNFALVNKNINLLKDLSNRPFIVFTIQEKNINRIYDIAQYAFSNNCNIIFNAVRKDVGIETFVATVNENYNSIIEQFYKANDLYNHTELKCIYPDQLAGVKLKLEKSTITHGTMVSCPALENELCILFDGTVTPCNMFNPYVYGNIFNQSLSEIWDGKEREIFLRSHKNYSYCKNCAFIGH